MVKRKNKQLPIIGGIIAVAAIAVVIPFTLQKQRTVDTQHASTTCSSFPDGYCSLHIAQNLDGRLEAFDLGPDNNVWYKWQTTPDVGTNNIVWSNWSNLGGPQGVPFGDLTGSQNQDGTLDVMVVDVNGNMWYERQVRPNSLQWGMWTALGHPDAAQVISSQEERNDNGEMTVVANTTDGSVWERTQQLPNNANFLPWQSVGAPKNVHIGRIKLQKNENRTLSVLGIGSDGNIWGTTENPGLAGGVAWSGWYSVKSPTGITFDDFRLAGEDFIGKMSLVATASDGNAWILTASPQGFTVNATWMNLGKPQGVMLKNDSIHIGWDNDQLPQVFVTGMDNNIWTIAQNNQLSGGTPWTQWTSLGSPTGPKGAKLNDPNIHINNNNHLVIFVTDENNELWHSYQKTVNGVVNWSNWIPLGTP